ncbi:MAG: NAD(P)-dependent oxidoreductase [Muribaculum sp.]|nr:NAD(P)-dependent oxidoreductase [Muribaculum sp.]
MKRVLIVGAGGFIGGFIAEEALRRGCEVWCALRESTSRRFLTDSRLKFVVLDYDSPDRIAQALLQATDNAQWRWDWIIYNLGATKVANYADFNRINCVYLQNFITALRDSALIPERMLYMSSLSALGPHDEKSYTPYIDSVIPFPNTRYGTSKIKAETLLDLSPDIPWIIFRPTGVYGPHDKDYAMMISAIDHGVDFRVGLRKQLLSFIYVEDLAAAMFDALEKAKVHKKYIISEPKSYSSKEVTSIIKRLLGRKVVMPAYLPLFIVKPVCFISEKIALMRCTTSTLNSDKYKILSQRNWSADPAEAIRDFGFSPRHSLADGMKKTVEAYRKSNNRKS